MERGVTLTSCVFDARVIIIIVPPFLVSVLAFSVCLSAWRSLGDGVGVYAIRRVDITKDEREETERHEVYAAVCEEKRTQTMYTC